MRVCIYKIHLAHFFKIIKDSFPPRSIPASSHQKHLLYAKLFVSLSTSARSQSFFFLLDHRFSEAHSHTHINLQPAVSNASEVDDTSQRTIFIKPPESDLTTYCDSLTHSREFPHKKQSRLVSLSSIELQGPERSPRLQSQHSSVL